MTTDALLQHFLMYFVVPVWLLAGIADWFCHRRAHIELSSGIRESLLHVLQFGLVGIPLLAALFLKVNAAVLLVMLGGLVLHQATAMWDVRYADNTRGIAPAEQHIHGVLEMIPFAAVAIIAMLNWPALLSLLGGWRCELYTRAEGAVSAGMVSLFSVGGRDSARSGALWRRGGADLARCRSEAGESDDRPLVNRDAVQ